MLFLHLQRRAYDSALQSVSVVHHTYWGDCAEPSLHPRGDAHSLWCAVLEGAVERGLLGQLALRIHGFNQPRAGISICSWLNSRAQSAQIQRADCLFTEKTHLRIGHAIQAHAAQGQLCLAERFCTCRVRDIGLSSFLVLSCLALV